MTRLRYRLFQAVAIAALAAVVTACAAFAPLYDRAMRQALTDIAIQRAGAAVVGLQLTATADDPRAVWGTHSQVAPPAPEEVASRVRPDLRASYRTPVLGYGATVTAASGGVTPRGLMIWRSDVCAHLDLVEGACPARSGEVAVSEADLDRFHLRPGTTVRVSAAPQDRGDGAHTTVGTTPLTVVGVYRQRPGAYWFGLGLTGMSGIVDPSPPAKIQHDVWVTGRATFEDPGVPLLPGEASTVGLPLDSEHVGVDEVLALGTAIERLADDGRSDGSGTTVAVYSGLPDIADDVRHQTTQSRVTVPLLMAQLGLLAVVVLWLVLRAVTEQRRPEVALARLRGRGRRGARGLLLGELLPVALAGVVPGCLLAVAGAWAARTLVLPGSAPFELGLRFLAAVVLAVVVLAAVTVLAVSRVAREPVATLLRRVPPRRAGWALGVADALAMAASGAVVVLFATGGLDGPVALAAPGLLAVLVGLVLAHLVTPSAAIVGRRLIGRGWVRSGLCALDAARSPATRRVVAIVTLASALAIFSADALVVGDRNRAAAADQEAGAPMVAEVDGSDLANVRAALAEVDPQGRDVTPVARVSAPGTGTADTLAVEPRSFRRIALLPGGRAASAGTWGRLLPGDAAPIRLTGSRIGLDVDDSTLRSVRVDGKTNPVTLGVDVVDDHGETLHVTLGDLSGPVRHRSLSAGVACHAGCYLTGVRLGTLPGASMQGRATLRGLHVGSTAVALGPATRWQEVDDPAIGTVQPVSTSPDELTVRVSTGGTSLVSMPQAWLPTVVPALVAGSPPDSDRFELTGLDGEQHAAVAVGTLPRVPGSQRDTRVVDLDLLSRGSEVAIGTRVELWFADDDPTLLARVESALHDHGISVAGSSRLHEVRSTYDDSAAAWSLQLAALVGGASLLIALLVLVVSAVSSWRVRARDLAALRMSGVPRRLLATTSVAAQLPAVAVGIVAGTLSGLYGAHLALPIVPLFATTPAVSTLDLATAWAAVVLAALAAVAVLGLGAVLVGRALAARADVQRLRESL